MFKYQKKNKILQYIYIEQLFKIQTSYNWFLGEISLFYSCELSFYFLVQRLQTHRVSLDSLQLFLNRSQTPHCTLDLLDQVSFGWDESLSYYFEVVHLRAMLHGYYFLLFSLLFTHALFYSFTFSLLFFFILFLYDCNAFVEFSQQVGQLGIYFVYKVAEIDVSFVINSLEKHHWCEILLKVLQLVFGQLSL